MENYVLVAVIAFVSSVTVTLIGRYFDLRGNKADTAKTIQETDTLSSASWEKLYREVKEINAIIQPRLIAIELKLEIANDRIKYLAIGMATLTAQLKREGLMPDFEDTELDEDMNNG